MHLSTFSRILNGPQSWCAISPVLWLAFMTKGGPSAVDKYSAIQDISTDSWWLSRKPLIGQFIPFQPVCTCIIWYCGHSHCKYKLLCRWWWTLERYKEMEWSDEWLLADQWRNAQNHELNSFNVFINQYCGRSQYVHILKRKERENPWILFFYLLCVQHSLSPIWNCYVDRTEV